MSLRTYRPRSRGGDARRRGDFIEGRFQEAERRYDLLATKSVDEDAARTLEVKRHATRDPRARDAVRPPRRRGMGRIAVAGIASAAGETRRSRATPWPEPDPARFHVEGAVALDHAIEAGWDADLALINDAEAIPTLRIAREALRQRAMAACARSDRAALERVRTIIEGPKDPFCRRCGRTPRRDALHDPRCPRAAAEGSEENGDHRETTHAREHARGFSPAAADNDLRRSERAADAATKPSRVGPPLGWKGRPAGWRSRSAGGLLLGGDRLPSRAPPSIAMAVPMPMKLPMAAPLEDGDLPKSVRDHAGEAGIARRLEHRRAREGAHADPDERREDADRDVAHRLARRVTPWMTAGAMAQVATPITPVAPWTGVLSDVIPMATSAIAAASVEERLSSRTSSTPSAGHRPRAASVASWRPLEGSSACARRRQRGDGGSGQAARVLANMMSPRAPTVPPRFAEKMGSPRAPWRSKPYLGELA